MLPNEIMQARFPRALQRLFGIQGEPPTPQLSGEVIGTAELISPATQPELHFLLDERLCRGSGSSGAPGAGNYTKVSLANPANSGVLLIVEEVEVFSDLTTEIWTALLNQVPAGTLGTVMVRDTRWPSVRPVGVVNHVEDAINPAAGAINVLRTDRTVAERQLVLGIRAILSPGWSIRVGLALIATPSAFVNFSWRERALPDLERTL